ncbi:MAG TPA: UDP-2,3-diacylglucosamine diphosphatase [Salinisphaeraceae bacterium]|nr:UDP-2,3-diacylglucosamine diphosphatase [Salinisphaeraceae bacterium]
MATHFLADLHLQDDRGQLARKLHAYLAGPAHQAAAVYVLGDLFDVWIGDDGSLPQHRATINAFAALAAAGTRVYFMRGNRDFAVGEDFFRSSGMRLLPDPQLLDLYGIPTLLSHGDLLCTDDHAHQAFRQKYLDPRWRRRRLRLPLWFRRVAAAWARRKSSRDKARKPRHIMDVNGDSVLRLMHEHGALQLIHGHTHRPETHDYCAHGEKLRRIVLPDWRPGQTGVLVVDENGCRTLWLD